jgi:hypothetical protein
MQALLDMLDIEAHPVEFTHFPENKNGNILACKGRLLGQNFNAKGKSFNFCPPPST